MSPNQKYRQRRRLKAVDQVIATVDEGLKSKGMTSKLLDRLKAEVPLESEMLPRDKYTTFSRQEKGYRIGLHRKSLSLGWTLCLQISQLTSILFDFIGVQKWTRKTIRVNPKGF